MKRKDIVKTAKALKGAAGHRKVIDVYNAQKPLPQGYKLKETDAWCAATVSVIFLLNGYSAFSECSCPRMVEKAKKAGLWKESDAYKPQLGDVVMYDWQDDGKGDNTGQPDHVGVVISTGEKTFTVREGNKGGTIANRDMPVNGKFIRGFITPRFAQESKKESEVTNNPPAKEKPQNEPNTQSGGYIIGKVYTVTAKTGLNVRTGAGTSFSKVSYSGLTADGRKHASPSGALLNGTKVTCLEVKKAGGEWWMRIPSGWVCASFVI